MKGIENWVNMIREIQAMISMVTHGHAVFSCVSTFSVTVNLKGSISHFKGFG